MVIPRRRVGFFHAYFCHRRRDRQTNEQASDSDRCIMLFTADMASISLTLGNTSVQQNLHPNVCHAFFLKQINLAQIQWTTA